MQGSTLRYVLSALALLPAGAAVLLPQPARQELFTAFGLTGTLLLWSALACAVIHAATRPLQTSRPALRPDDVPVLLRRTALQAMTDLPTAAKMRERLGALLSEAPAADARPRRKTPVSRTEATALALSRTLDAWNTPTLHGLGDTRVTELYLLAELISARPDQAGALAQHFAHPAKVLDLRDRISELGARHDAFQRQRDAYQATLKAWSNQPSVPRPSALLTSLQAMDRPDIDLWHRVVLEHDPHDPAQREAALWCARQPQCDRATIASYLSTLAADGHLEAAARQGDRLWLGSVLSVIEAWNAGVYSHCEIGLIPVDAVSRSGPVMSAALDRLAKLSGQPRWPEPRALFADYPGRAPRPRDHWCLQSGRIVTAPDRADYFDPPVAEVA